MMLVADLNDLNDLNGLYSTDVLVADRRPMRRGVPLPRVMSELPSTMVAPRCANQTAIHPG